MSRPLRLAVSCPVCHRVPPVFAYPGEIQAKGGLAPDTRIISVQCQGCGNLYAITAIAYVNARVPGKMVPLDAPPRRHPSSY